LSVAADPPHSRSERLASDTPGQGPCLASTLCFYKNMK
jgi:hypothetical protein